MRDLIVIMFAILLAGCGGSDEDLPGEILGTYPRTLAETDEASVVVAREGEAPVVLFTIIRRASERFVSVNAWIGSEEVPEERITKTIGKVFDTDIILPKGVGDLFRFQDPDKGTKTARISAVYDSGKEYKSEITYKYE